MKHFTLKGEIRQKGNKAVIKAFRRQGLVPCNLYGQGIDNILFTVVEKELKGLTHTPASYIVDLVLGDKTYTAVAHEYQWHPVEDTCLHVDFLAVSEDKPIAINVPLKLTGHPVGAQAGGKFTQSARSLKVSGLMKNLPDELELDVTPLELDKRMVAGDVKVEGLQILSDKNTIICSVKTTRAMQQAAQEAAKNA
ncbi:MAG: 50S ribosomal protein L25 [Bacteroidales bacterium]|jgi:large subunit ribosomal protein L25|nr:50S ribosomal protein L25 [Bacteroidales bacterium]